MEFIQDINLNLTTLLIVNLIPFIYFGYQAKYWWHPKKLAQGTFMLASLVIILAALVILKFTGSLQDLSPDERKIVLMHLMPLAVTFLILSWGRKFRRQGSGVAHNSREQSSSAATDFSPVPLNNQIESLSWDDLIVGSELKEELASVIQLLGDPKMTEKYGIDVPKGILLSGPPGTGKTTIAKVIANTAGLSFFVLKLDEVISKWVGESEKNLSALFNAATKHSPSVIFVDEIDSIGKQRSGESRWAENLLNHLLQHIDGVVKTRGLYIIGATNRADLVDSALKRAGRLNKVIEVPAPDLEARMQLFNLYLSKLHLEDNVDLYQLAEITEGKTGADIKEICNQAGLNAFSRESGSRGNRKYLVSFEDLARAVNEFVAQQSYS